MVRQKNAERSRVDHNNRKMEQMFVNKVSGYSVFEMMGNSGFME